MNKQQMAEDFLRRAKRGEVKTPPRFSAIARDIDPSFRPNIRQGVVVNDPDYTGQTVFSYVLWELLQNNYIWNQPWLTPMLGIKDQIQIPALSTTAVLQPYACETPPVGDFLIDKEIISVCKLDAHTSMCPEDLVDTFMSYSFAEGASTFVAPTMVEEWWTITTFNRIAADLDRLYLLGDTASPNPSLQLCDGLLKRIRRRGFSTGPFTPDTPGPGTGYRQVGVGPVTVANALSILDSILFAQTRYLFDQQQLGQTGSETGNNRVAFFCSSQTLEIIRAALRAAPGNTTIVYNGRILESYSGVQIYPVGNMPNDLILYTYTNGIQDSMSNLRITTNLFGEVLDFRIYQRPGDDSVYQRTSFKFGAFAAYPEQVVAHGVV